MSLINSLQTVLLRIEWSVQPVYRRLYKRHNVFYYFMLRLPLKRDGTSGSLPERDKNVELFLLHLCTLLEQGKEIQVALGEMGRNVIDDPRVIRALSLAYFRHDANIEILHGPHVHPGTHRIFHLAGAGIVKLYQTSRYIPHHFIIIKTPSGEFHIADENPHNEALWKLDQYGQLVNYYRSIYRVWYIIENSQRYVKKLQRKFEWRIRHAELTPVKPPSANKYKLIPIRILINAVSNGYIRYVRQPLDLISDSSPQSIFSLPGFQICLIAFRNLVLAVLFPIIMGGLAILGDNRFSRIFPSTSTIVQNVTLIHNKIDMTKEATEIIAEAEKAARATPQNIIYSARDNENLLEAIDELYVDLFAYLAVHEKNVIFISMVGSVDSGALDHNLKESLTKIPEEYRQIFSDEVAAVSDLVSRKDFEAARKIIHRAEENISFYWHRFYTHESAEETASNETA